MESQLYFVRTFQRYLADVQLTGIPFEEALEWIESAKSQISFISLLDQTALPVPDPQFVNAADHV